jgi:catechol 2,3-dioxygenase-like lactoylglutathione lyase family enzyme
MIRALHTLVYADDPERARAFFRDVLGWPHVDAGGGWLIFKTGPSELGVHPTSGSHEGESYSYPLHHTVSLMCDDIEATVAELTAKGVVFTGSVVDLTATMARETTAEEINRVCGQKQKGRILFNRVRKRTMFGDQDLAEIAAKIGMPTCKNIISLRESYAQAHVAGWRALPPQHRDEIFSAAIEIVT